tara:strand:- start:65 stop:1195 length:1131 start_codon:yes stop_codon:yes gene_type:complete
MSGTPKINIPDTPKNKDPNKLPVWHGQQELILKRWSEIGSSYRYLHDKSFKKFDRQNMWFALPVIVISTVTGTANFAQGSFPQAWKDYVPLGIGFFNLSAGLITTVSQFLRVSELLEGHRAASIAYSKFSRNISVELSLPIKERTEDGSVFISNCRAELDRLIEQSPDIPEDIVTAFVKRFPEPEKDASGNKIKSGYEFFRPEILDIKPIKIYRDNAAEEKRKLKAERALAKKEALEQEVSIKKIIAQKDAERKALLDQAKKEFEDSQKKRDNEVKQIIELAQKQTKKELIKNKFSVTNIEESMNELLGSLNQTAQAISDYSDSSSDSDNSDDKPSTPTVLFKSTKPNIKIVIDESSKEETVVDIPDSTDSSGNDV